MQKARGSQGNSLGMHGNPSGNMGNAPEIHEKCTLRNARGNAPYNGQVDALRNQQRMQGASSRPINQPGFGKANETLYSKKRVESMNRTQKKTTEKARKMHGERKA